MSKPELIIQDSSGFHNSNIDATRARLVKGGSWKNQRVVVIVPAAELIPAKVYLSHCSIAFPPNNGVARILALGQEVGQAYSDAIQSVIDHPELSKYEYIFTLEHDNIVPYDGVIKLIEHMENNPQYSVIGGLYYTKGFGGVSQIWGDPRDPNINFRPQLPDPNGGLVECCGTGMGATLFRLSMFKDTRLRRPWFKTTHNSTQDLYFFGDSRKYGYKSAIACDVKCGHYDFEGKFGPPDFTW